MKSLATLFLTVSMGLSAKSTVSTADGSKHTGYPWQEKILSSSKTDSCLYLSALSLDGSSFHSVSSLSAIPDHTEAYRLKPYVVELDKTSSLPPQWSSAYPLFSEQAKGLRNQMRNIVGERLWVDAYMEPLGGLINLIATIIFRDY